MFVGVVLVVVGLIAGFYVVVVLLVGVVGADVSLLLTLLLLDLMVVVSIY